VAVSTRSPRLVALSFERCGDALWTALFRAGRPVQYSHLSRELELWDAQTAYAARPWAVEAPSAGLPLTSGLLAELRRRGVAIAPVTQAAGLSSTGDAALDATLPFPERFEVGAAAAAAVAAVRSAGGRVVAAGTSVVRALESAAGRHGPRASTGVTNLRVGPEYQPRVVDGLLTGIHEPGTSHFELLQAFAPREALDAALAFAEAHGYLGHEFGDALLVLPPRRSARTPRDVRRLALDVGVQEEA
jgi:S-adenosylmethionine:tRNA ribosyltransferase-isomerase